MGNKKGKEKNKQPALQQHLPVQKKNAALPWLILAAAITAICFLPMLQNGFTNWDDDNYVLNNALLRGPDWAGIFTQPVASNYHPVTIISLALNYAISGTGAWSYLALNLLLHVINTMLVFMFIYKISEGKIFVAFFTALVFGIHPMHVESVAWISERKDVLYTFFFFLSLLQYWRFLETGKQKSLWICFLFFVLSLLSKPAAIILPLILFLLDYLRQRPFNKKLITEKIPFILAAVLFTVVTFKIQSATAITSLDVYPLWVRFFFASYTSITYFIRFFIPYPLSAFQPFPAPGNLGWLVYLSPLFILSLFLFTWRFRKNKSIIFGLLFFFINLLLVMQFISIGLTIISERYTYMPYVGLAFSFAMVVNKYMSAKIKTPLIIFVAAAFSTLGFLTFQRVHVWEDSGTLWSSVIDRNPTAAMPRGKRAEYNYTKVISSNSGDTTALLQRVVEDCSVAINRDTGSLKQLNQKQQRNLYYMRGTSYNYLGQSENAFKDFSTLLIFDPGNNKILFDRGTLLANYYKNYAAALSDYNNAIKINPQGLYFLNRSICYYNLGDTTNAKADAQAALQKRVNIPGSYLKLLNL